MARFRSAATTFDISVLGDKALERDLRALPKELQKDALDSALKAGGEVILAEVAALTPVRSGRLKKGLRLKRGGRSMRRVRWFIRTPTRKALRIAEDAKYYYPAAVEYGHGNVPAKSFLRRGYDNAEEKAFAVIRRELDLGILRVTRKFLRQRGISA